jgi:mannose-6-phosphate isomerase
MKLYPLQFEPILKDRIWGGTKLKSVLHKPIATKITGESWELSTVKGDVSVVANGDFAGKISASSSRNIPKNYWVQKCTSVLGKNFRCCSSTSTRAKICRSSASQR